MPTIIQDENIQNVIICQQCVNGYITVRDDDGNEDTTECDVCEGDPVITFATVKLYADHYARVQADNVELRHQLEAAKGLRDFYLHHMDYYKGQLAEARKAAASETQPVKVVA